MTDKDISMTNVSAWALWLLGGVAIALEVWSGRNWVGHLGILSGAAAATLHVRGFFCQQGEMLRNAYQVGRDAARAEVPVQRIR